MATTSSRGRGRGFGGGRGRAGGSGRGSIINAVTDQPVNAMQAPPAFPVNGLFASNPRPASTYGKTLQTVPPFDPEWLTLQQQPRPLGKTTAQGLALAEFSLCTFDDAVTGYDAKTCAACKRPYTQCVSLAECTHVPAGLVNKITLRTDYTTIVRSNRAFNKRNATAVPATARTVTN